MRLPSDVRDLYANLSLYELECERAHYQREASDALNPTAHALATEDATLFEDLIADRLAGGDR